MDFQKCVYTNDQSKQSSVVDFTNTTVKPISSLNLQSAFTTLPSECSPIQTARGVKKSTLFESSKRSLGLELEKIKLELRGGYTQATLEDENEIDLTDVPQLIWCAYCGCERATSVRFKNSARTFWSAVGIFLMGGVLGCFAAPYMMDSCKQPEFVCGRCERPLNQV